MGKPKSPGGRTIGPFRAFPVYETPSCPQDPILKNARNPHGDHCAQVSMASQGAVAGGLGGGLGMLPQA